MQKRKSFFNNEMEQRFSLRKYTIGLCSVCLGFVVIGMGSQSVKADTVNDVEKSSTVQENKAQDMDSANTDTLAESKTNTSDSVVAKSNTTPTETKENEAGSVAATAPKTADSNNSASVNTLDQSKSENSSAVAPTSEKTQLQTSQDSSIKSKENSLNNKSNAMKAVFKLTNLNKENNSSDPNSKDAEVKPKESSNLDTNEQKENDVSAASASTVLSKQPANAQTKLVRRPVMRLAAATATNSDELIVGKDVTVSDFSVTTANGKNEFENSHANIKFTMHADDPSALVDKRLTIQVDTKVWSGFYSSEQQDSNPATISYQGHVIGTLNYGYPFKFVYITFNNHVKDYTSINLQSDLVVAGTSQNDSLYKTDLYTPTQAKDGQTYYLTNDIVIGQQKYSSNLPSTIHYYALNSEFVSSVTDVTTTSYTQSDSKLYAGTFYKTPDGIYYSRSAYYSDNSLYDTKSGRPGYLQGFYLNVGTDIVTDHTQSYTATFDIDQTKLSPDQDLKFTPITSYYLDKDYWDDKNLLPNTRDVYVDKSHTSSTTVTADATVIKNGVIFNKLNGQSLATRIVNTEYTKSHWSFLRSTNYIKQDGRFYITPALFKQLQAVAESDQNLTEAIKTVTTTGRTAEIKLVNPIDTGVKAKITTSDGKTKEVPLLIDTIVYPIRTASTAPKGAILVAAQGKTAKVYHHGDQNIPSVVDQSQLTKTITRTINVHEPGKSVTTTKQTVTLTQSVSVVDGKDVTYNGDWKVQGDSQWASYDVPSVPGYTASQSSVAQQEVTDATKDQTVNITYTANDGTQTIVYQDEDGSEIDKQVISGKTDETVKVTPDVPDGYVLKGEVPSEVTIKPDDTPITVTVEHGKSHVTPDKPVNKGDLIPSTKDKHYPEGLTHNDLNKTVTREVTITDPTGKKSTTTQTVTFTRGATVDEVTNKVTYDDWSENGKHTFDKVDVPNVPGYTASGEVPSIAVTPETQSSKVDITYTANDGTQTIVYQDEDGSEVGKQVVPGKTDEKVKVTPDVPDGYVLKGEVPSEVTIKPDDTPITVTVEHGKSHVTPDKPVNKGDLIPSTKDKHYPEGLTHNDLNKTVTREVTITDPTGKKSTTTQTVTFTRGATVDEVTNKVTYDDWSENGKHAFDKVDVPTVPGYTVSGEVPEVVVTPETQSSKVDITYTANAQHMMITYVDDTTGKKLHTDKLDGVSDQDTKYTTVDSIKQYTDLHYKLVSDSTNGKDLIFDHDDNADQSYEVHFVHGTHTINQTTSSKQTIHYVYADDLARHGKAADDNVQQLSFKRDGYNDEVTGTDHWNAWIPANSNYSAVDSPVIQGYTPDKAVIEKSTVNPTDKDTEITIVYNGDKQSARVIYVDKTTNATLTSNNLSGKSDKDSGYNTKDTIEKYQSQHYVLTGDETDGKNVIFDHDDKQDQTYYVYFVHGTKNVSRDHSASFTVHYIYKGGKQAKSDHEQALSFTENGIQDLVTQKITWTPADSQKFDDVVTPVITGYTPDQNEVIGQTANFETGDREVTVTYLPDVQLGHINYIDDNTGKTLTRDDFSGRTNEHEDYTSIDRIQEFENKGYVFVSSDYPDGGFNFDDNDQQDQVFNVHLKHGIVTVTSKNPQIPNTTIDPDPHSSKYPDDISNTNSDVKRTIDYKFKDGKTAQPTVNDSLHFERTVVIDKVTGDVLSDTWTPSQDFNDVQTPVVQGYTPDRAVVSDKNIGHDHQNIVEHVVYSPDAQHMTITYIDDTTSKKLHTDKLNGVSDQDAKYATGDIIKQYEDQHYKLVSDSTKGKDLIFDHDDNADQTYEVHFIHSTHTIDQTTSPKQTIHYVYADDLARQGKAADDNVQQLSFKRDGYNDEVTGIDHWHAWTPANSNYSAVDSPVIQGYTPDKSVIEKSTVNPTDKDTEITVVYNADKQSARVIYVDKTTNTMLTSNNLSGKSDKDSGYNTEDKIGQYKSQHYVLFEDETNGKNVVFDHNDKQDQTYYVYFVHGEQKVNRQDTVTSTINYKFEDGKTAQPTVTQTKHFSEDGVKDLVTGKIAWDEAKPQKFEDVATKSIVGYTPDKDNVVGHIVKFGDQDVEVTVTYHNNAQTAKITYIDDTEKKSLGSDQQNGKFDHEIIFEHDPAEVIKGLEEKGYKLVSNNFKQGIKYQNDNKFNIFEVHLVHTYEPVETSQTITETIHYIDVNGKPVAPDYVAKAVIEMTGTRDKVTNSITWNTPSTGHFDEVISPEVPNMTPDKKFIPSRNVQYGDSDITENVVYTSDETSREPEKPNDQGKPNSKTPEKPNKSGNPTSKTSEKSNKSSKEVSKQFGTIAKTTIPEKPIDSRTVDNHVSAKTTTKRELPQTGTTANTGIWTGLVSIITSLGLLGASKKRKKN